MVATAYTDGGCRNNDGTVGVSLCTRDGREVVSLSGFIGRATSNQAEYQALIWALKLARNLGVRDLQVFSDSALMVHQMLGGYQVHSPLLKPLRKEAIRLARLPSFSIQHIPRALNGRADALAGLAFEHRCFQLDFSGVIPDGD